MMHLSSKNGFLLCVVILTSAIQLRAEDGSRLWLRFNKNKCDNTLFSGVIGQTNSLTMQEFQLAWNEMTGNDLKNMIELTDKSLIIGTSNDEVIKTLGLSNELKLLGNDGYMIRTIQKNKKQYTVIASLSGNGLLYGTYHLLRLIQTNQFSDSLHVLEKPSYTIRILNHWDNLDGTVERGYAGHSIWKWDELPTVISPRYKEYARANASIGINATVLNNVNASPKMLSGEYLTKVKAIAAQLRPFHIKVYLSINFSSPKELGGLPTSDPLNNDVQKWWKNKVTDIYKLIPDFGGFLVKANSEGLPGPMDYGRTHVDGANMLADALKPFGGIVMWRAFVYEPGDDRAKLAYTEFHKFDGQFRENVILQVKNGPIDFQPREPFSPLFGAMKKTALMPELQITQEYLGQGNHLVFLASLWKEFMEADTYAEGVGTTISKLTTGQVYSQQITAISGVANIGDDANWCGHHFAQANWYAFGRLAWNNKLTCQQIAEEWITMTFQNRERKPLTADCRLSIRDMMLTSHQMVVNYMMPLGLHHLFAWNHHYGPEPWCDIPGARPDWLPKYYHRADSVGLGFDRTTTGSNAVSQYSAPVREQFNDLNMCPEKFLLWFHHVPWNYHLKSGKTLWEELCYTYDKGVQEVREYQKIWDRAEPYIDKHRFTEVQSKLKLQAHDALWWKEACLLYFQTFSNQPIPSDIEAPVHDLDSLKKIKLDLKQHN